MTDDAGSARDARTVAEDHLAAVRSGDPGAMAADYAEHAVLARPGERFEGRAAIVAYFATVPERLAGARVVFDSLEVADGPAAGEGADSGTATATFRWHLEGSAALASGTDVCTIRDGMIVHQVVRLDGADF